jgi:tetratricopeptide (TPR) repeat protein
MSETPDEEPVTGDHPILFGDQEDDLSIASGRMESGPSLWSSVRTGVGTLFAQIFGRRRERFESDVVDFDDFDRPESDFRNATPPEPVIEPPRRQSVSRPQIIQVDADHPPSSRTRDEIVRDGYPSSAGSGFDDSPRIRPGDAWPNRLIERKSEDPPTHNSGEEGHPFTEFTFEKDEFQIGESSEHSRKVSWGRILLLPFRLLFGRNRSDRNMTAPEGIDEIRIAHGISETEFPARTDLVEPFRPGDDSDPTAIFEDRFGNGLEFGRTFDAKEQLGQDIRIAGGTRPEYAPDDLTTSSAAESPFLGTDEFAIGNRGDLKSQARDFRSQASQDATDSTIDDASQNDVISYSPSTIGFKGMIADVSGRFSDWTMSEVKRLESILTKDDDQVVAAGSIGGESERRQFETEASSRSSRIAYLGRVFFRLMRWFFGIPLRCLSSEGDILDQSRLKIEPILASIPAVAAALTSAYFASEMIDVDKIAVSARYVESFRAAQAADQPIAAGLSAERACLDQYTPYHQYLWGVHLATSKVREEALRGYRQLGFLASPEGGDQPDAHLFLAEALLRQSGRNAASREATFRSYLIRLRAAYSSAPTRYDILERLADGILILGDEQSLQRLLTPNLEYWPSGHFYLAQTAFVRGDRTLQDTHATALVRHYRNVPSLLENDTNAKARFAICLALSGELDEADSYLERLSRSQNDVAFVSQIRERLKLIRVVAKLDTLPGNTDLDIDELGRLLLEGKLSAELKSAVRRQLLKKGARRPALLELGRKLRKERESSFDADDYLYWSSVFRQNGANDEAREYLENSLRLAPDNSVAANNLANLLYKVEPKDLNRALALIEKVLVRDPGNVVFVETRGQILSIMGRDEEAVRDLVRSLEAYPDVPEIHESLARSYRRLGSTRLADFHQARSVELKAGPAAGSESAASRPNS